jgi:hypothetical protein
MSKPLTVGLTWLVAVLILAAWLCVLWEMWWRVDTATDAAWSRMVAIMTALQAVAFAAAGALFGVKVQESQTDKAKADASEGGKLATMVKGMKIHEGTSGQAKFAREDSDWRAIQAQADQVLARLSV